MPVSPPLVEVICTVLQDKSQEEMEGKIEAWQENIGNSAALPSQGRINSNLAPTHKDLVGASLFLASWNSIAFGLKRSRNWWIPQNINSVCFCPPGILFFFIWKQTSISLYEATPFPFNSYGSFGAGGTLYSSQNAQPTPNNRTLATLWREAVEIKGVKDLLGVTFGDSLLENESNTEEMEIFKT